MELKRMWGKGRGAENAHQSVRSDGKWGEGREDQPIRKGPKIAILEKQKMELEGRRGRRERRGRMNCCDVMDRWKEEGRGRRGGEGKG